MPIRLKYDGKYGWIPAPDDRQWTIVSHWKDVDGLDRFRGSFSLRGLVQIGLVPAKALDTAAHRK